MIASLDACLPFQVQQESPRFLKGCGADRARPELFSMWTCFAGNKGLMPEDFAKFDRAKWSSAADSYKSRTKVDPHVATVAKVTREQS